MHGHPRGPFTQVKLCRNARVGNRAALCHEEILQARELRLFAGRGVFRTQTREGFLQQRPRPTPFEQHVGGQGVIHGIALQTRLGQGRVEGQGDPAAAAPAGLRAVPFVGEEPLQGHPQEGAEASALLVGGLESVLGQ